MIVPAIASDVPVDPTTVGASQPPRSGSINGFVHGLTCRRDSSAAPAARSMVSSSHRRIWSPLVMRADTTNTRRSARPELVIGLSGAILFVLSFVPWWGSITTESLRLGQSGRLPSASGRFNAYFGYGWPLELAIALGLAAGVLVVVRTLAGVRLPRLIFFGIGLAMTVLVLASVVGGPVDSGYDGVAGITVSRGPLVVAAIVPSLLIALAGIGFARSRRGPRRRT